MKRSLEEHHWIWIGAGAAVIILVILGLILFNYPSDDEEASEKADQLIAAFELAGIHTPDKDTVMGMFGNDGGAVCEAGSSDLGFAELNQQLANGAAQAGIRPVLIAEDTLKGEALVLSIYCPDELPDFNDYVNDLNFEDVINK